MILHCTKTDANSDRRRWYVAKTHPRKEVLAQQNLESQGFVTFFPKLRPKQARPRPGAGLLPLFPGYLFLNFDPEAGRWQAINSTYGVKGLIGGHAGKPAEVAANIVTELVARCPSGIWDVPSPTFSKGQAIDLVSGPFAGRTAQFEELLPHERVRVLMTWLNNTITVTLPLSCIDTVA